MAVLYFSSPLMQENLKVEAPVGEPTPLMKLVEENDLDIPYACESGMCGLCLIKVKQLNGERMQNMDFTDRELEALAYMDKLPKDESEKTLMVELSPTYRLACQTMITDEDWHIEFPCDEDEN